jgi:tetratricopeptide (TPR) repeat protein
MENRKEHCQMTPIEKQRYLRETRWAQSRKAESRGDYKKALEIHKQILAADSASYAVFLRAGWLSFRLGAYEEAIGYYEKACAISNDDWPVQGIMNCLAALGDAEALAKMADSVYGAGKPGRHSAAA